MIARLNYTETTGPVTRVGIFHAGDDPYRHHFANHDDEELEELARDAAGIYTGHLVEIVRGDEPDSYEAVFERA